MIIKRGGSIDKYDILTGYYSQLLLLEESWRELFVLSAAQFFMPIEGAPLLAAAGKSFKKFIN